MLRKQPAQFDRHQDWKEGCGSMSVKRPLGRKEISEPSNENTRVVRHLVVLTSDTNMFTASQRMVCSVVGSVIACETL